MAISLLNDEQMSKKVRVEHQPAIVDFHGKLARKYHTIDRQAGQP